MSGPTIQLPQWWTTAGDPPPDADMRWMEIALQAEHVHDDGRRYMN